MESRSRGGAAEEEQQFLPIKGRRNIPDSIMAPVYDASIAWPKNEVRSAESAEVRSVLNSASGSVSAAFLSRDDGDVRLHSAIFKLFMLALDIRQQKELPGRESFQERRHRVRIGF